MGTRIALAAPLLEKLRAGDKPLTIRYGRRDYPLGVATVHNTHDSSDSVEVDIWALTYVRLIDVEFEDMEACGYERYADMLDALREFYPDIGDFDEVTIVRWAYR